MNLNSSVVKAPASQPRNKAKTKPKGRGKGSSAKNTLNRPRPGAK